MSKPQPVAIPSQDDATKQCPRCHKTFELAHMTSNKFKGKDLDKFLQNVVDRCYSCDVKYYKSTMKNLKLKK